MELAQILDSLSSDGGTKTASADSSNEGTTNKLAAALNAAVAEVDNYVEKTASVSNSNPTEDLTKIATRLANAEQEALIKEAELYGAALCDGFMSRMTQYEGSNTKTASYTSGEGATFEKFASENPELVKQAAELGYRETKGQLEKVASDAYTEGYVKTAEVIKQAAEACAQQGAVDTYNVLKSLRG